MAAQPNSSSLLGSSLCDRLIPVSHNSTSSAEGSKGSTMWRLPPRRPETREGGTGEGPPLCRVAVVVAAMAGRQLIADHVAVLERWLCVRAQTWSGADTAKIIHFYWPGLSLSYIMRVRSPPLTATLLVRTRPPSGRITWLLLSRRLPTTLRLGFSLFLRPELRSHPLPQLLFEVKRHQGPDVNSCSRPSVYQLTGTMTVCDEGRAASGTRPKHSWQWGRDSGIPHPA
ncbi:unnamed protein product [Gadus morhua 'NCC']